MKMRTFVPTVLVWALCLGAAPFSRAAEPTLMERSILDSVDAAKEPIFSEQIRSFINRLPPVERIMAKEDSDLVEEARFARGRIAALLNPEQNPSISKGEPLPEATGIVLVISQTKGEPKVKGALSCVCIDKNVGLFLTALHPFQEADLADCVVIVGIDGSISGVARTLLRKTEADVVLLTTRARFPGQVKGVGRPPKTGEPLWVSGSCPGAVFFQLGTSAARTSIPNWKMLGRLRAKSFDVDRGFPNGLSGGGVFNAAGELVGIAERNIAVSSHGSGGAALQMGRAVEVFPLIEDMR
jgi:hypothetical protein